MKGASIHGDFLLKYAYNDERKIMDDATLGQFADNAVSLFWEARGTAMGTVISAYQDMAEGADAIEKILKDAAG